MREMPIKWDPLAVENILVEVEKEMELAMPHIEKALDKLQTVKDVPDLPQYITQPLMYMTDRVRGSAKSVHDYISRIRRDIPAGALESARNKGRQTTLIEE